MLRQRRRRMPFTSDSSDDNAPQPKKQLTPSRIHSDSVRMNHSTRTRKRHRVRQEDDSCSSDSSLIVQPRKHWKKLPVSTSEESSTSDNEEILHPARRGALKALSDYETGDSSDKVSEASPSSGSSRDQRDRPDLNERGRISEADSSDSGIPIGLGRPRKHRRFPINSEESDSPELFNCEPNTVESRSRGNTAMEESVRLPTNRNSPVQQSRRSNLCRSNGRRRRIHHAESEEEFSSDSTTTTTTEGGDFEEPFDGEHNRRVTRSRGNGAVNNRDRRTISRVHRTVQHTRNEEHFDSDSTTTTSEESDSDESLDERSRRVTRSGRQLIVGRIMEQRVRNVQHRRNNQSTRPNRQPALSREAVQMPQAEEEELSSDSIIRPSAVRQHRITVFTSGTSSSDESGHEVSPVRRGARIAIHESDEDVDTQNTADSVVVAGGTQAVENTISSDSDGESEKCPICLGRFGAQEVGVPSSCDHSFCLTCIQEWAKTNNTCPVDRQTFSSLSVRNNIHSKVSRRVTVRTPPAKHFWEAMDLLENIAASLIFASEDITSSSSSSTSSSESESDEGPVEMCYVCGHSNDIVNMISCDSCYRVYHLGCLNPPLNAVPGHEWYCPNC